MVYAISLHHIVCRLGAAGLSLTTTTVLVGLVRPVMDGKNVDDLHHLMSKSH